MSRAVERALRRDGAARGKVILAAVSGGADSVAMLHVLCSLRARAGYRVAVAHLNHCLRGDESERDEAFVRALCLRLEVELRVERASQLGGRGNLEERAREVRYAFLNRVAEQIGAALIAVAHQADDQAETVLMRLFRGSSISGLGAMLERGPGRLFRPLLGIRRKTLVEYLQELEESWMEDSTNAGAGALRNRIRHGLIPLLEHEYAPGVTRRLCALAHDMQEYNELVERAGYEELIARQRGGALCIRGFGELPAALGGIILRQFVRDRLGSLRGLGRVHFKAMREVSCGSNPSARVKLPGRRLEFRREYEHVIVDKGGTEAPPYAIPLNLRGATQGPGGFEIWAEIRLRSREGSELDMLDMNDPMSAIFDIDALRLPLWVRSPSPGERIRPLGMAGSRKLQDVFVDRKLARAARASWPLVATDEEALWAPGMVRSRVGTLTLGTHRVLHLIARRPADNQARLLVK